MQVGVDVENIFPPKIIHVIMLDQTKITEQCLAQRGRPVRHAAPCIVAKKTCNRARWRSRPDLFFTQWNSELEGLLNKIGAFKT